MLFRSKGGAEIEKLKDVCKAKLGEDKDVFINIVESFTSTYDNPVNAEKMNALRVSSCNLSGMGCSMIR